MRNGSGARTTALIREIEELSLNAWPCLEQLLLDGWVLRFSRGYTKRANSVNPLFPITRDPHALIETCERLYEAKHLPTIFKLTTASQPEGLDDLLASRDYALIDETSVQVADGFPTVLPKKDAEVILQDEPSDDWLETFAESRGVSQDQQGMHVALLDRVALRKRLATAYSGGDAVGCGLGVIQDCWVGLFDLIVADRHRKQGVGRCIVSTLLWDARKAGVTKAYLQVVTENQPALRLAQKTGFREAYRYWYRIRQQDH